MRNKQTILTGCIVTLTLLFAGMSWADDDHGMVSYKVTVTNLTGHQPLSPILVATHRGGMSFFQPGETASDELAAMAEAGNAMPLAEKLSDMHGVSAVEVSAGITAPGQTTTVIIKARRHRDHLSVGTMLVNTNDAFAAVANVHLPKRGHAVTYMAPAYDAGTETNDELCANVPGPACGGAGLSPMDTGEGFVTIHNGIHGIGGLMASQYDWRNPVAKIVVERMHDD
ncbi:MAG: spondin domain-containing protein [Gammaproteobacteria bacterium]